MILSRFLLYTLLLLLLSLLLLLLLLLLTNNDMLKMVEKGTKLDYDLQYIVM